MLANLLELRNWMPPKTDIAVLVIVCLTETVQTSILHVVLYALESLTFMFTSMLSTVKKN